MERLSQARMPIHQLPWGVNMFGAVGGASGLSEASRGVVVGLKEESIPVHIQDYSTDAQEYAAPYQVSIFHANPNQLAELVFHIPEQVWLHRYNIGFWVWEQEELPEEWEEWTKLFDELWTPSEFAAGAIRRACSLPVTVIPHIVEPKFDENYGREAFGLPQDLFLALLVFDCDSVVERKNPDGAISAFKRAFEQKRSSVGLVIKARNMTPQAEEHIRSLLEGWPNVFIFSGDYPKEQINSLIRISDVYLSLHRAEGFGLVLAEAMYLGTPVIATNWSANTEFMDDTAACMVNAKLVELQRHILPYRKGSRWAEPDVEQAAGYLLKLYENESYRNELACRAKGYIADRLGVGTISKQIGERMSEIKKILKERSACK